MTSEKERDCMRICYQHWEDNESEHLNSEQLSIITYAMLLEIINKPKNNESNITNYIEKAEELYQHGLHNGWMKTH